MNHIVFYRWGNCYEQSFVNNLKELGIQVDSILGQMTDYDEDAQMEAAFLQYFNTCIHNQTGCAAVISVDYFPLLSRICQQIRIPYICWTVDNPMTSMYSETITNSYNYIFSFDKIQCQIIRNMGQEHCYHMPLATDLRQWEKVCISEDDRSEYAGDVTLVANLYNDEITNKYQGLQTLPAYLKGYLDAIVAAQLKIYGTNMVEELLPDRILQDLKKYLQMDMGPKYKDVYRVLVSDMLNRQISMVERREVLNTLGQDFDVVLHTSSDRSAITAPKIIHKGFVDYMTVMPKIFQLSKINLNITSKSIQSGIPLRVIDILGCGGFVISNYQPELAELFEPGKEIVLYESMDHLHELVGYYLSHEEERQQIARAGHEKVKKEFNFTGKLQQMLETAGVLSFVKEADH